jgi:hypothetical protein
VYTALTIACQVLAQLYSAHISITLIFITLIVFNIQLSLTSRRVLPHEKSSIQLVPKRTSSMLGYMKVLNWSKLSSMTSSILTESMCAGACAIMYAVSKHRLVLESPFMWLSVHAASLY